MGYEVTHFFVNGIDFPDFCGVSRETLDEKAVLYGLCHMNTLCRTLGAYPCNHIIHLLHLISIGKVYFGDALIKEADGASTSQTPKMGVAVIVVAMMMRVAYLIACRPATVVNGMEQVLLLEEGECAEYGRPVGRIKHILYLAERKCLTRLYEAFEN